jgi:hypothetical protein
MVDAFGVRSSERAPEQGVHYQTASRWAREGNRLQLVVITPTGGCRSLTGNLTSSAKRVE